MPIDRDAIPNYVLLLTEHEIYALNHRRQLLAAPSDELIAFAKAHGVAVSVDTRAWDEVSRDLGMSPIERERHCCYILIRGGETEEELQRLIDL